MGSGVKAFVWGGLRLGFKGSLNPLTIIRKYHNPTTLNPEP